MSKYEVAMKRAESIATAINKKLGDTVGHARLIESPEFSYIELGFREKTKGPLHEVTVAYAADYFGNITTKEEATDKAKRIMADVITSMGREP